MTESEKKFLSISGISNLGNCETRFVNEIFRKRAPVEAVNAAVDERQKLAAKIPIMTKEQIINNLQAGYRINAREVMLHDLKNQICGRIDHLQSMGFMENGRNMCLIINDKYPKNLDMIYGITLPYKLQLTGYATAISNSEDFGSVCKVIGTQLRYREKGTDRIMQQFEMGSARLDNCISNVDTAISTAWRLYKKEKEPEHRRFDVEDGKWIECHCVSKSTTW